VTLARSLHNAAFRWLPAAPHNDVTAEDESKEARAERSLRHLDRLLARRLRHRRQLRLLALLVAPAVPVLVLVLVQRARAAFA
jgi:hypothetical protein